ncbi:MAG: ATP-dependent Clp protease adaptor protein ClpS [Candidatus Parcubacteria bacterium]|jgi:hypothetical protein
MTLTVDPAESLGWKTILFNCNCHTFESVTLQITRAIQCTREKANNLAFFAERIGSVTICEGTNEKCEKVAKILGSIGLNVTVTQ